MAIMPIRSGQSGRVRLRRRGSAGAGRLAHGLTLVFLVVWSLLPIVWLAVMSTQPERNYTTAPLRIQLEDFSLRWFGIMLEKPEFVRAGWNSIVIASATMVLCVALGSLAAYPLARLNMAGKSLYLAVVIAARLVPSMIFVVPMFLVARTLGILDTQLVLIAVYTALLLPFATWLLKNYFQQVPTDLERAARMDGCSRLGVLTRVMLPLSLPGIVATAAYIFIGAWNSFLFGLILTTREATPITLILSRQTGQGYQPDDPTVSQLAAAGMLTVIPVILLMLLLNRHIVRGLIPGSKG
jgi:ABC-type glycerol-3-phosphate transport system permease component